MEIEQGKGIASNNSVKFNCVALAKQTKIYGENFSVSKWFLLFINFAKTRQYVHLYNIETSWVIPPDPFKRRRGWEKRGRQLDNGREALREGSGRGGKNLTLTPVFP